MKTEFSYDDIAYPSYSFPQTSPDRLATIATLFGIKTAHPARCRVLEIGCGDGTNLLSHAHTLPQSSFTGLDLSSVHIREAQKSAEFIGARNTRFVQQDLADFRAAEGEKFDYVIAHGLFSWISDEHRRRLLQLIKESLAPCGIAYVSYNALPGCYIRKIVWDLVRFHLREMPSRSAGAAVVQSARELIESAVESMPESSIYRAAIEYELNSLRERDVENILHDDLSEFNQPFYLSEFIDIAADHKLKYLADADPLFLGTSGLSPTASQWLTDMATDRNRRDQYKDFVELVRFRSSLIVHSDLEISETPLHTALSTLFSATAVMPARQIDDLSSNVVETFTAESGNTFQINHPLTKASLVLLRSHWPRALAFDEICDGAAKLLGQNVEPAAKEIERMQEFHFELLKAGFLKSHAHRVDFATAVSERPGASRFARWQVARGCRAVTTLSGLNVEMALEPVRVLIALLDGTRTREQLVDEMAAQIDAPFSERDRVRNSLPTMIEENLQKMAQLGLLVS